MKNIKRKEEGVSPVIATILMVAITVVLAATLYMMLPSGGGGESDVSMNGEITTKNYGWSVSINSGTFDLEESGNSIDDVSIYNTDTDTKVGNVSIYTLTEGGDSVDIDGEEYDYGDSPPDTAEGEDMVIFWNDNNDNGKIDPPDSFLIGDGNHWLETGNYAFRIDGATFTGDMDIE